MTDRLGSYLLGPNDTPENGIYTGDARELAKAIPDESVDLVLTDPPFGIGFDYGTDYEDDPDLYPSLIEWVVCESDRIVKPGGLCFVYVAQLRLRDVWPLFPDGTRIFAACKNFVQMHPTAVQYAYDPVLFWQKPGDALKPHRGRDWHVGNTANTNNRGANKAGWHACPRPLDTITYMVDCFCPAGGIVVDKFMGSATTALAAYFTGRQWLGFEIDPATADLARQRVRDTQPPLFVQGAEQLELTPSPTPPDGV